jgi:antitoxin (DNA-binding transcriptional repressor) of toxin-antitoxin stability system
MISVGIRELKTHLSQYIDLVKQGENVLITEHNKVVAELKFPEPESNSISESHKILKKLVDEGKIIPPKRKRQIISPIEKIKIKQKEWWHLYQESKEN